MNTRSLRTVGCHSLTQQPHCSLTPSLQLCSHEPRIHHSSKAQAEPFGSLHHPEVSWGWPIQEQKSSRMTLSPASQALSPWQPFPSRALCCRTTALQCCSAMRNRVLRLGLTPAEITSGKTLHWVKFWGHSHSFCRLEPCCSWHS